MISAWFVLSLLALLLFVGVKLNAKSRWLEARCKWLDARESDLDARERAVRLTASALDIQRRAADLTLEGLAARVHLNPNAQKEIA